MAAITGFAIQLDSPSITPSIALQCARWLFRTSCAYIPSHTRLQTQDRIRIISPEVGA